MRKVIALGAIMLLLGSISVVSAQERGSQTSGLGVGTGVGDVSGSSSRAQAFDKNAFLERLSQPETVMGRIFALDFAQHRLMIETGGVGNVNDQGQEGKVGAGARTVMTLYMNEHSNVEHIHNLNAGDEVYCEVREETTASQPFGTGRKMVHECTVYRGATTLSGFGGLGQRPNPSTERGITTQSASTHGGEVGKLLPGEVHSGITTTIGDFTGAAPCWQCEPQPGWGFHTLSLDEKKDNKTDYGNPDKPDMIKK